MAAHAILDLTDANMAPGDDARAWDAEIGFLAQEDREDRDARAILDDVLDDASAQA